MRLTLICVFLLLIGYSTFAQEETSPGIIAYINELESNKLQLQDLGSRLRFYNGQQIFGLAGRGVMLDESYPVWSPDGKSIAFNGIDLESITQSSIRQSELFITQIDTGVFHTVYQGQAFTPRFSPDGSRLAFINFPQNLEAAVLDLGTGKTTSLGSASSIQTFIGWSPDAEQLAFPVRDALVIINADGTNKREVPLDPGYVAAAVWSPDGTEIAVGGFDNVYLVNVETLEAALLVSYRGSAAGCSCAMSFSVDGRYLALSVWTDQGAGVRVLDLESQTSQDFTLDSYLDNTRFSPDGQYLLLSVTSFKTELDESGERINGTTVRLLNLESGTLRDLVYLEGGYRVSFPPSINFDVLDEVATIFTPTATYTITPVPTATLTPTPTLTLTPTPTPIVCVGAPPTRLSEGITARVTISPAGEARQELRVRSAPSGDRIAALSEGISFKIIGQPVCQDGYLWWQIETLDGIVKGWSAEGALPDDYFIEPVR